MSHIATIKTQITDLEAVKLACKELGLTFLENQTTCKFWPSWGRAQEHPCSHAIALPVGTYEMTLGLVREKDGSYTLVGDDMLHLDDVMTCRLILGRDTNPLGSKYGKFLQAYGLNKATMEAKRKGYIVTRKYVPNSTSVQLVVTGV
jgi:hypothetical protein